MSSNTPNIGLVKPALGEPADITVINGNMDIVDSKFRSGTTASLSVAGWSGSEGAYTQVVSVPGATASNDILFSPAATATEEAYLQYASCIIRCTGQGEGTLTFTAHYKPTVAIPMAFKVFP